MQMVVIGMMARLLTLPDLLEWMSGMVGIMLPHLVGFPVLELRFHGLTWLMMCLIYQGTMSHSSSDKFQIPQLVNQAGM